MCVTTLHFGIHTKRGVLLYDAMCLYVFYLSCRDSRAAVENCSMTETTAQMPKEQGETNNYNSL